MIPPLPPWPLGLDPPILNRHAPPNTPLIHRHAEQPPAVPSTNPQLLARSPHRVVLPLQLELFGEA